jgi:hypothetical protein
LFGTQIAHKLHGFLKGQKGTGTYVIKLDGDKGAATKDDGKEWVEELMTCLGLTPDLITLSQTEYLTSDLGRQLCHR